jgi:hypothetical protein
MNEWQFEFDFDKVMLFSRLEQKLYEIRHA